MMFSRGLSNNSRILAPFVGIFLASNNNNNNNDGTQCDADNHNASKSSTSKEKNGTMFQNQCLERQLYKPNIPYPAWDYNWDGRMTPNTTLEALSKGPTANVKGKTRHVILIRHGQYDETYKEDEKRVLTKLGRIQAELTGRRLAALAQGAGDLFGPCRMVRIVSSDMTRAKETAAIISKYLPHVQVEQPDEMLNEALPAPIIPVRPEIDATREVDDNADRMEAAFYKYIHRADPQDKEEHTFEVIVCHGNVIRFLTCRALQIPPEAWLRMSLFNCSLTYLMIKPNGYCSCRMLGDVGHLDYEYTTFSNGHGFVWS